MMPARRSWWGMVLVRLWTDRTARVAIAFLSATVALCVAGAAWELALGVDPNAVDLDHALLPPGAWPHVLGTDELGRDVLARLARGGRVSLVVALVTAVACAGVGTLVGMVAGWYGGTVDGVLMRLVDFMLSIPMLPLLVLVGAVDVNRVAQHMPSALDVMVTTGVMVMLVQAWRGDAGTLDRSARARLLRWATVTTLLGAPLAAVCTAVSSWGAGASADDPVVATARLVLLMVLFGWMGVARLARAATLQIRHAEFVDAGRALGATDAHLLRVHVLPNVLPSVMVAATLEVGSSMLTEAALSFLGVGIRPPTASWGNMLTHAQDYVYRAPLLALWPGLMVLGCVLAVNLLGDALRDAADPRSPSR